MKHFYCIEPDCKRRAVYGSIETLDNEYCIDHHPNNYVRCAIDVCKTLGCTSKGFYSVPDDPKRRYCVKHRPIGSKNASSNKCSTEDCQKLSSYSINNIKYCSDHRPPDACEKKHKKCIVEPCGSNAKFRKDDSSPAEYCGLHIPQRTNSIKNKMMKNTERSSKNCIVSNCSKRKLFSDDKTSTLKYCIEHKSENYKYKSKTLCIKLECVKRATNCIKDNVLQYCNAHRPAGAINPLLKYCQTDDCKEIAYYKNEDKKVCIKHKTEDSIRLNTIFNKCKECNEQADYGTVNNRRQYCKAHKKAGMLHRCSHWRQRKKRDMSDNKSNSENEELDDSKEMDISDQVEMPVPLVVQPVIQPNDQTQSTNQYQKHLHSAFKPRYTPYLNTKDSHDKLRTLAKKYN